MPRSCSRSSTFRSDRGYRTYIITARRMICGLVLKYLNMSGLVMIGRYETNLPFTSQFPLTRRIERWGQREAREEAPHQEHNKRANLAGSDTPSRLLRERRAAKGLYLGSELLGSRIDTYPWAILRGANELNADGFESANKG